MAQKKHEPKIRKQALKQSKVNDTIESIQITSEQTQAAGFAHMSSAWQNFYAAVSKVVKD